MKTKEKNIQPLAWRVVPSSFKEFFGQKHLFSNGKPLRSMVEKGQVVSMLLWGPPGSGKTAFSRFIAEKLNYRLVYVNAVTSDVSKIRQVLKMAEFEKKTSRTLLVVDEIEHFSRLQQNVFLPALETGGITMIGISFENPYYRMNTALMSRLKVFEFKPLAPKDMKSILEGALSSKKGLGGAYSMDEKTKNIFVGESGGDARRLLNLLELAAMSSHKGKIKASSVGELTGARKYGENDHYDMISAFIKSVRGSDADAALYWLASMLKGGEDPRFIARRLLILASEDIGNADPQALVVASSAYKAVDTVGMPEARIILSQVTIYCALTYKSNAAYEAISKAQSLCAEGVPAVPAHLTKKGSLDYKYPHSFGGWVPQKYSDLKETVYRSKGKGFEKELDRRNRVVRKKRNT